MHLAKQDNLLSLHCLLFLAWNQQEALLEAASLSEAELGEEKVVQEVWLLFPLAVSSHIFSWLKEWKEVFCLLTGILHPVLGVFEGYNQEWLGRAANLVGPTGSGRARMLGLPAEPVQTGRDAVEGNTCNWL